MSDTDSAVEQNYDRLAPEYDQRWSTYIARSIEETIRRMPVESGMRVLDVGCGTGKLLRRLLEVEPDLEATGVDLSDEMLEVARRRLPDDVELLDADATDLPFDDGAFDLVVSTSAFHHIDEPDAALAEMRRMLTGEGRLVLTDWCTDFWPTWLIDRLLRWREESHYRAYDADELAGRLKRAGFTDLEVDTYKIQWHWGMVTLIGRRSQGDIEAG